MLIEITGTPGTGKSSVAKELAKKLRCGLIDIKKIVNERNIFKKAKKEKEVDIKKLEKIINDEIRKATSFHNPSSTLYLQPSTSSSTFYPQPSTIIIEGHLACEIKIPVQYIFVLRCRPDVLEMRLKKRRYSKKKIEQNLLAEMLDYCVQRAMINKKRFTTIIEIETHNRNLDEIVGLIVNAMKKRKRMIDKVDYRNYLIEYTKRK